MAKPHDRVRKALSKTGDSKGKLHSHSVKYERADNGGIHAHVERHTSSGPHHTEHHVLNGPDEAAEHLQEHLGDQPPIGGATPPDSAEPPEAAAGGAPAGAGGGAPAPGMGM